MEQRVALPAPALMLLVHRYRSFRYEGFAPRVHHALPSRRVTVMVSLDGPITVVGDPGSGSVQRFDAFVGGLRSTPVHVADIGHGSGIAIELEPLGVRALFAMPAAAVARQTVDLADVWGPRAGELAERLSTAGDWCAQVRVLDRMIADAIREPGTPVPAVSAAWRRLVQSGGSVRIATLAGQVGPNRRHLSQVFTGEYGLSPKEAGRVVRFERAVNLLERDDHHELSAVAAMCGYFDQAHLDREWRTLAEMTPTEWRAEQLRDPPNNELFAATEERHVAQIS